MVDNLRIKVAFITFGTVVYMLWSVIVVAAQDILSGTSLPTTVVLLVQVLPFFIVTFLFPFFIQKCSYWIKIGFLCPVFASGIMLIGLSSQVKWKLFGVAVSSVASGAAESTFVPLTAKYNEESVSAYFTGSGIGFVAAPLYYSGMTILGCISPSSTILFLIIAVVMLPLSYKMLTKSDSRQLNSSRSAESTSQISYSTLPSGDPEGEEGEKEVTEGEEGEKEVTEGEEGEKEVTEGEEGEKEVTEGEEGEKEVTEETQLTTRNKILLVFHNFSIFLMLFTGMFCEYLILQSVITTMAFPEAPFRPRDHYVIYSLVILAGELIGRSYGLIVKYFMPDINPYTRHTWCFASILTIELLFLIFESWYRFLTSVWIILFLLFPVGAIVGALYVTSIAITGEHETSISKREFSRAFVLNATPTGILAAALLGLFLEPLLREHCERVAIGTQYCITRSMGTKKGNMTCVYG